MNSWSPPAFEVREAGVEAVSEVVLHRLDALSSPGLADRGRLGEGPLVIGLAGSVAAGKSRLAAELRSQVGTGRVEIIGTDGFLFPNATLSARGLAARKGFPESYDGALATAVLGRIAGGERDVLVPTYSHQTYDVDGPPQLVRRPEVVIVEGVNALLPPIVDFCALRVFLDADERDLQRWYVERFVSLVAEGEGFYRQWAGMPAAEVRQLATMVWEHVNLPNLTEHILPTRWTADVVVRKGPDHRVVAVALRVL